MHVDVDLNLNAIRDQEQHVRDHRADVIIAVSRVDYSSSFEATTST
jgi:hypothetical protein